MSRYSHRSFWGLVILAFFDLFWLFFHFSPEWKNQGRFSIQNIKSFWNLVLDFQYLTKWSPQDGKTAILRLFWQKNGTFCWWSPHINPFCFLKFNVQVQPQGLLGTGHFSQNRSKKAKMTSPQQPLWLYLDIKYQEGKLVYIWASSEKSAIFSKKVP